MPESHVELIEDQIRTIVQLKSVRVAEFFKDFDRLRSGYVTGPQFRRCLKQSFEIVLPEGAEELLLQKYQDGGHGRDINYRRFADVIECAFRPDDLKADPKTQITEPTEFFGSERSVRPLSPASQTKVDAIICKIAPYYKYHGIDLRNSYEDFDKHNIGVVTASQFERSFPRPPGLTDAEVSLIGRRYQDPERAKLVNYFNFYRDVEADKGNLEDSLFETAPSSAYNIPRQETIDDELNTIFKKIQEAVHKNGIRTTEFFCDHDKLRKGIITENQFVCGLMLCAGKEASLTRGEVQKLVDFYKNGEGRVAYKPFCDRMENAFNDPHFEKNPQLEVYRPPRGALATSLVPLTDGEDQEVNRILEALQREVKKRRLMTFPTFKDFDRSKAYTRNITKDQFRRILDFLTLNVGDMDFKLLCKKFEGSISGDVNYPAFVQAIDKEFVGFIMDSEDSTHVERVPTPLKDKPIDISGVSFEEIMRAIRHQVLVNRHRVCEYFQDFDPLQERSIPKSQFRMGLSALGHHNLKDAEFEVLFLHYENPQKRGSVLWRNFEKDIDTVFTQVQPNLEKTPTSQVPPSEVFLIEKPGTIDWSTAPDETKRLIEGTLARMRQRVEQRRVMIKPCFQDFDLHNRGTVTRAQFRQCLTYLGLRASVEEMGALEAKYSNQMGFDYLLLLRDLQPSPEEELKYVKRLDELKLVNSKTVSLERNPLTDINDIMDKIKTKVIKEKIRVLEFMRDYDKLRSGRILKTVFRRSLDLAQLELQLSEVTVLEQAFEHPQKPDYVEYLRFSDEVESIFTLKNLEKAPLVTPVQFKPPAQVEQNVLSEDEQRMLLAVMGRLAERVYKTRMQLYPLFEDYDRVHNGSVSRSQFCRVMSGLDLGSLVSQREFLVLYKKFEVKVGYQNDVNYIAFCDMLYKMANMELFKP